MSRQGLTLQIGGMVQGVGYRYFCYRVANQLGLTGWVRNNPDGSVTVVAEGDRSRLEILIKELKTGPSIASITRIDVTWSEATNEYNSFSIEGW